jgi:hypothetical protein
MSMYRHGLRYHPLYMRWHNMHSRVTNSKNKYYENYKFLGVTIYDRWNTLENFIEDMFDSYIPGAWLDRIDNNGEYSPINCRWTTKEVQSQNTRKIMSTNKSGYRGVNWCKKSNAWRSRISVNSKRIQLGSFKTPIDAARAYDKYVLDNNLEHTINNIKD